MSERSIPSGCGGREVDLVCGGRTECTRVVRRCGYRGIAIVVWRRACGGLGVAVVVRVWVHECEVITTNRIVSDIQCLQ